MVQDENICLYTNAFTGHISFNYRETIYCVDRCCPLVTHFVTGPLLVERTSDVMKPTIQSVTVLDIKQVSDRILFTFLTDKPQTFVAERAL